MLRRRLFRNCKRCFGSVNVGAAPVSKFKANIPFGSSAKELPTPLVFVSGEGLSTKIWSQCIDYFSSKGYHGQALELPYGSPDDPSVDDLVEYLQGTIKSAGDAPPVLIAHSLSSYIAQKFLESYSLSGLILVNPIPMSPQQSVSQLLKEWNSVVFKQKSASSDDQIRAYYRAPDRNSSNDSSSAAKTIVSEQNLTKFRPFSLNLGSYIATNPEAKVNLEPGSVPMSIIASGADVKLLPEDAIQELMVNHDVLVEHCFVLREDSSRLSMISDPVVFNGIVHEWLNMCT